MFIIFHNNNCPLIFYIKAAGCWVLYTFSLIIFVRKSYPAYNAFYFIDLILFFIICYIFQYSEIYFLEKLKKKK